MTIDFDYNEYAQTVSTSSAAVANDRMQSVRQYSVAVSSSEDLYEICQDVLGWTNYAPSQTGGALNRLPPVSDPVFTMAFADSIPRIVGKGKATQATGNTEIELESIGDFSLYPQYDITVSFSQRQYSLLEDEDITVSEGSWTPDVNSDSTGSVQTYYYPNEWTRYTECFPVKPTGDYLTQQGGTLSGTMQFANTGPAANKVCAFMPSVRVPNFLVSLVWRQVPLRYITSSKSYFNTKNWQNRVNQNAITLPFNGPGDSCAPGSLLYTDYSYVAYTPPTGFVWNTYGNGDSSQKLCDITINFIWTTRTLCKNDSVTTPTNANYIAGGHNLLYWNGDFCAHYATLKTSGGDSRPVYLSAPLELLQCDPDSPQPNFIG